jgi:hypothetical protein
VTAYRTLTRIAAIAVTAGVMVAVQASLRMAPGLLVRWGCATGAARNRSGSSIGIQARDLTSLVDRAGWYLSATCLERALTLLVILRLLHPSRNGARLLIGAAHTDAGLRAHAWVEASGHVLLSDGDDRFAPLVPSSVHSVRQA